MVTCSLIRNCVVLPITAAAAMKAFAGTTHFECQSNLQCNSHEHELTLVSNGRGFAGAVALIIVCGTYAAPTTSSTKDTVAPSTVLSDAVVPETSGPVPSLHAEESLTTRGDDQELMPPGVTDEPAADPETFVGGSSIHAHKVLPSRVRVFLKQAHNNMRRACGKDHTSMREVNVTGWSQQIVGDGTKFVIKYNPVFKLSSDETPRQFEMSHQKVNDDEKITEKPGRSKTTADKFHIIAMVPEVCDMHNIFEAQQKTSGLDPRTEEMLFTQQRFTGHIEPPKSEITFDTTVLTQEQIDSIPDEVNWHEQLKGVRAGEAYNQGSCGSCYAWASTTAYGYRLAKAPDMTQPLDLIPYPPTVS